jgi:integrase
MRYTDVPAFMARLRNVEGYAARALEFAILTASRSTEAAGARWSEVEGDVWTVPQQRMKAHREHRVPLSGRAVELLADLPRENEFIFPAARGGALNYREAWQVLRGMGHAGLTVHGFRSAFRTWAEELTSYPHHVIEQALAHTIGTAVERAYRRTDMFEQRRKLMEEWASYCNEIAKRPNDELA